MIEVKNLVKKYGNHLAVNNIHLQFEKGTFRLSREWFTVFWVLTEQENLLQ